MWNVATRTHVLFPIKSENGNCSSNSHMIINVNIVNFLSRLHACKYKYKIDNIFCNMIKVSSGCGNMTLATNLPQMLIYALFQYKYPLINSHFYLFKCYAPFGFWIIFAGIILIKTEIARMFSAFLCETLCELNLVFSNLV